MKVVTLQQLTLTSGNNLRFPVVVAECFGEKSPYPEIHCNVLQHNAKTCIINRNILSELKNLQRSQANIDYSVLKLWERLPSGKLRPQKRSRSLARVPMPPRALGGPRRPRRARPLPAGAHLPVRPLGGGRHGLGRKDGIKWKSIY